MIIFFVIIASVIVGIVVANFAKMKGHVGSYAEGRMIEKIKAIKPNVSLTSAIFQKLDKLPAHPHSQRQAAEAISNLFTEELSKKVSLVNQQLDKKYEKVIDHIQKGTEIIKKKYKKLGIEKKQTEAVIRSIAEGLVVVNENGEVLLMNPAAEKLLGAKKEQKIGKSILKDLKDEQLISLATKPQGEEGKERVGMELSSGGEETKKVLRASTAVIENEYGKTVGMVSVLSDVTKQRELDQMKSDFVSKVSHELRTPIVTTQNSISLLLNKTTGPLTQDQEKFLTIAQRNLKRLSLLINDILDLSKIDASKMKMEFAPHSIEKLIDEVCDTLVTWAKAKTIKIEKRIQKNIPEVNLDFNRMIQVLNNIIGNAVKFTSKDGIVIVEAGLDGVQKNVLVSVADTGVGIAKENLSRVFDKFQQVGERVVTDIGGTGLGLSIAKEIIGLHGGKIWAESEKKQGAKFFFTLPITTS